MCFLAGAALGSVFSGWVSDRYGRKHTLMAFASLQVICGKFVILIYLSSCHLYSKLQLVNYLINHNGLE